MASDEREFRLRPPKPRVRRGGGGPAWSSAFKKVMHYSRMSRRLAAGAVRGVRSPRPRRQRCAVRVTYSPNRIGGQWRAHGKYISRDSAVRTPEVEPGFTATEETVDVADRLDEWQSAGDERVFKLILSPEFGDRVDLTRLTRETMRRMETELSRKLEWCAVAHFNTEHPHVHVALRGKADGRELRLDREYIKVGIRNAAEDLCTAQLGYRTERDAIEAERREVAEQRLTSLDRLIGRVGQSTDVGATGGTFSIMVNAISRNAPSAIQAQEQHVRARLVQLHKMGLAEPVSGDEWQIRRDFAAVLRAMQQAQDRQRILQAHGALLSDDRLPLVVTNPRKLSVIEGRVLTHGEEDSGRQYMLLEGTDAQVHFIYHTPEIAAARSQGKLRANSFVRFQRMFGDDGRPVVETTDMGDADRLLKNRSRLRDHIAAGSGLPAQAGGPWSGWLGKYSSTVAQIRTETPLSRHTRSEQKRSR